MKRRILLVDDELAILLTLKAILELNGFEVETASSAREGIEKLEARGPFAMVITDMRMETETAGYDVIRSAKRQPYKPATSILTAYPALGSDWKSEGAQSLPQAAIDPRTRRRRDHRAIRGELVFRRRLVDDRVGNLRELERARDRGLPAPGCDRGAIGAELGESTGAEIDRIREGRGHRIEQVRRCTEPRIGSRIDKHD